MSWEQLDTPPVARAIARSQQQRTLSEQEKRATVQVHRLRTYAVKHSVPRGYRATGRAVGYGQVEVRLETPSGVFAAYGTTDLHALRRALQEAQTSAGTAC